MTIKNQLYIDTHTSCYWDQCNIRLLDNVEPCEILDVITGISTLKQTFDKARIGLTNRESYITTWICHSHIKDLS